MGTSYRPLPILPSTKNAGVSDRVNAAIMKGMAIQPEYRPQSMAEWLDMLELSPNLGPTTVPPQPISPLSNQPTPIVAPGPNHRPGMSAPPKTKPKLIQNLPPQSPFSAAPTLPVAPGMNYRPASPPAPPSPKPAPTPQPIKSLTPVPTPVVQPVRSPGPAKVVKEKAGPVRPWGLLRRQIQNWIGLGALQRITLAQKAVKVDEWGRIIKTYPVTVDTFVEELGNGIKFTMVQIPAGTFMMGAPENELGICSWEKPLHRVTVSSFLMGMTTVTQAVYEAVMGKNPSWFKGGDRPVESVSWNDAIAFCQKLSERTGNNYRLPSEAEWEYACRAGTTTPFHFGPTLTTAIANYRGTDWTIGDTTYPGNYGNGPKGKFRDRTEPVGRFPPNAFGLFEMDGNVQEWCADHCHENYEGAPFDGGAWLENTPQSNNTRVIRGGSWNYNPRLCRSAFRSHYPPDAQFYSIGFRVILAPR